MGNEHARCVERCDLRCKCCCSRLVKTGDIVIIPAGVPHGWAEIKEHVDYLSFRPSADILTVGYQHPSLKK